MKKKFFAAAALSCASALFAAEFVNEPVVDLKKRDVFNIPPAASVHFDGVLGASLDSAAKVLPTRDINMLVWPFKARTETRMWKSEFWGKWYTSAVWAYRYNPSKEMGGVLDEACARLIQTQDSKGAIKTVQDAYEFREMEDVNAVATDMTWDMWGRKYTLLGLLAQYERTGDRAVLEAAKKHADYIIARVGDGKKDIVKIGMWFGAASSSILEPIALLYQYTGEGRYLDFADYIIAAQKKSPRGRDFFNRMRDGWVITDVFHKADDPRYTAYRAGGSKAYETTSCFEGLLEMYRITGNPDYLKASQNLALSIRESEIMITGSCGINEKLRRAKFYQDADTDKWQETCVTATWVKFCTQLLRLTGDPIYAADIELAAFNSMIAPQKSDGSWWCHNSPLNGARAAAEAQCLKGNTPWTDNSPKLPDEPDFIMNCCVASGPRGLFTLPKSAFMTFYGGVVVNLYENSSAKLPVNGGDVELKISGLDWGQNSTAKISVEPPPKSDFTLRLFVPQWGKNAKIFVNGKPVSCAVEAGKYADINRTWSSGDVVEIDLNAKVEVLHIPGNPDIIYLKYGPFVLSMDRRFEPKFDKPADIKTDAAGAAEAKFVKVDGANLAFDISLKDGSTRRFIDYASAGATWDKSSAFTTIFKRAGQIKFKPAANLNRYK